MIFKHIPFFASKKNKNILHFTIPFSNSSPGWQLPLLLPGSL